MTSPPIKSSSSSSTRTTVGLSAEVLSVEASEMVDWQRAETAIRSPVAVTTLDRTTGPVMFWVSLVFLGLVAGLMFSSLVELSPDHQLFHLGMLAVLYPLFPLEWLWHRSRRAGNRKQHLYFCLLPPLRMAGRDHVDGGSIWLPRIGWARVDRQLRERLERAFSVPMILIALAVLPLLGIETYFRTRQIEPDWRLDIFLKISESVIWMAFAVEFLVMMSIVDKKFRYCKEHWIELAIICLPLIGFLRVLRLGQALRLQQLSRVGRVYRLRGVSTRLFRGLVVLDVIDRFVPANPEKRLRILRERLAEREAEVDELRRRIGELEQTLADHDAP